MRLRLGLPTSLRLGLPTVLKNSGNIKTESFVGQHIKKKKIVISLRCTI